MAEEMTFEEFVHEVCSIAVALDRAVRRDRLDPRSFRKVLGDSAAVFVWRQETRETQVDLLEARRIYDTRPLARRRHGTRRARIAAQKAEFEQLFEKRGESNGK